MIDLAAAAVLVRELTEQQLEGKAPPPRRKAPRRTWVLRVASAVTQRRTEEPWPPRKSRTSAC
jgi:hypothetical protein